MKLALRTLVIALCIGSLAGCAATVPVKVAAKSTKLGVKTAKVGVKTTAKAGAAVLPSGSEESSDDSDK